MQTSFKCAPKPYGYAASAAVGRRVTQVTSAGPIAPFAYNTGPKGERSLACFSVPESYVLGNRRRAKGRTKYSVSTHRDAYVE